MRNEEYSKLVEDYKEILQYIHDEDLNKELIQLYVYNDLISEDLTPEELLIANEIKSIQAIVFPYFKSLPLFHGGLL